MRIVNYQEIDKEQWNELIQTSSTGNWFQSCAALEFYAGMPELFKPFAIGMENEGKLRAVCVGYVTVEKSALKQMMTRRAIIVGGPALADDCTDAEVAELMKAVRKELKGEAIYVECRNFNDYSKWKGAFKAAGFEYVPHLNFHVDTSTLETIESNLGKSRKRDIRTTIREGVSIVEISNLETSSLESSTLDAKHLETASLDPADLDAAQLDSEIEDRRLKIEEWREKKVREYYAILEKLYKTKVKTPLFPVEFFLELSKQKDARFLLTELNGKVIGGTVCVMQEGKCLYEWFACGEDGVYPHVFPSCYATYAGIKYAAEHGCARFDMMGAGKPDEAYGVRDFKAKFGGKEVEHGRYIAICKPLLYRVGVLGVKILKRLK